MQSHTEINLTPEAPNASATPAGEPQSHGSNLKYFFISLIAVVLIGGSFLAVYFLVLKPKSEPVADDNPMRGTASEEERAKPSYIPEKSEETGTYELFGSDEARNNSGEAFIDYQNQIVGSASSTEAEVFDAKISQAVYYIALGMYDQAEAVLNSLDQSTFSASQQERFAKVSERLATAQST